jgi:hypothetical protein
MSEYFNCYTPTCIISIWSSAILFTFAAILPAYSYKVHNLFENSKC